MKDYINTHPLIKWNAIEKQLGIPTGTLRPNSNRNIPDKYMEPLKQLLLAYGLNTPKDVLPSISAPIEVKEGKVFTVNNGMLQTKIMAGNRSLWTTDRSMPNGTVVNVIPIH